jgi:hypothetical protein
VVLAVVTAVVDASGAGRVTSAAATLAGYRPALVLITGGAAIGMLVALSGLRSEPELAADQGGGLTAAGATASPSALASPSVPAAPGRAAAAEVVPVREFAKDGPSA